MPLLADLADGLLDLVLGSSCVACGAAGRALCASCRSGLPRAPGVRWPSPTPSGLVAPYAVGDYDEALRALVLAHKEHRVLSLARPLGELLARSARAALDAVEPRAAQPVLLVPVPSRVAAVRERGHDPTAAMTAVAARHLTRRGRPAQVGRLLQLRPGVIDQAGLDTRQRSANLAGSMTAPSAALRRQAERQRHAHVIICDDVLTTGATLREAQRALEAAGIQVLAAAVVAATRRRSESIRSPVE